jgi:hypothetical protein
VIYCWPAIIVLGLVPKRRIELDSNAPDLLDLVRILTLGFLCSEENGFFNTMKATAGRFAQLFCPRRSLLVKDLIKCELHRISSEKSQ